MPNSVPSVLLTDRGYHLPPLTADGLVRALRKKMSDSRLPTIKANAMDHVASALRAVAGAAPIVGSALSELVGYVVPKQRIERITDFAQALEARISGLESRSISSELSDEKFSELLEEALQQAARSTSSERREHLAEIVSRSLTTDEISHSERTHLLRILSNINDIELIWLGSFVNPYIGKNSEYLQRHKEVLKPVRSFIGAPQAEIDKGTLQDSYKAHLAQLGLLDRSIQLDRNEQPEIDRFTGDFKFKGYRLTRLGRMLLKEIGLNPDDKSAA